MERYYRVFVSSISSLKNERDKIFDMLRHNRMIPISMEDFCSPNNNQNIKVVRENLNQADIVILIASFLYGTIISSQSMEDCQLTTCNKCVDGKCNISYTEYEYRYSIEKGIPCFCIVDKNFDNEEHIKSMGIENDIRKQYLSQREQNAAFIKEINKNYRMSYSSGSEFEKVVNDIIGDIKNKRYHINGLIIAPTNEDPIMAKDYVEEILFPMFKKYILSFGKKEDLNDIKEESIRCVIAMFFVDDETEKRITIYDLPQKPTKSIKDKNYGVVGKMNDKKTTVLYDFEQQILYYTDRDTVEQTTIEKKELQTENMKGKEEQLGDRQMDNHENCGMLLAIPIKNKSNEIKAALTFDFSTKASEIIRRKVFNSKRSQQNPKLLKLFSMCESFAQVVMPFVDNFVYSDLNFFKKKKEL